MIGAEALLRTLRAMGVEHIFASPGSDWAPLWEALAKPYEPNEVPEYTSSRHEETAVCMASGYFQATGKLPAVVLHTTVGVLHAAMALRQVLHQRLPMVVLAGESITFGEPPGPAAGRQWLRLLTDVGGPARLAETSVKWSFGLNSSLILPHTIQRACQLAMAAPRGPVCVSVPTEFLMEQMSAAAPAAAALPAPPAANEAASAELARALCAASNPVIVTEELGRDPKAVDRLVELAEALAAPVLDGWHADYVNFPRSHPLYAGTATEPLPPLLAEADFVLLVEAVAGWHPPSALRNTRVAALGEDPLHSNLPFWGFRADHVLTGDAEASLARLTEHVKRSLKPGARDAAAKRRGERIQKQRAEVQAKARAAGEGRSITAAWAAYQINQVLPPDAIVVNETISHRGDIARQLDRLSIGSLYEASYGGLGMGLGTALGVKFAHRDRPVVMLIGDGSFYYNPVLAAFGACQEHALPMLVVMFDNAGYFSQKGDVVREFPDGWAVRTRKFAGTSITPRPDYPALARAFGGYGEQVETPREVRGALERGLQAVSKGHVALINLVLDPVN